MQSYVGMYVNPDKVKVDVEAIESPTGQTRVNSDQTYTVILPLNTGTFQEGLSDEDYLAMIVGLIDHEIGHILWTSNHFLTRTQNPVLRHIFGILEDGRIEWKFKQMTPLGTDWIDGLNWRMFHLDEPPQYPEFDLQNFMALLIHRVVMCEMPTVQNPKLKQVFENEIEGIVKDIYFCDNTREVHKRAKKVFEVLKQHFPTDDDSYYSIIPNACPRGGGQQLSNDQKIDRLLITSSSMQENHELSSYPSPDEKSDLQNDQSQNSSGGGDDTEEKDTDGDDKSNFFDEKAEKSAQVVSQDVIDFIMRDVQEKGHNVAGVQGIRVINMADYYAQAIESPFTPHSQVTDEAEFIQEGRNILGNTLQYLAERFKYKTYGKSGKLQTKKLHRVFTSPSPNPRIFVKNISDTKVNVSVSILLDASGSMDYCYNALYKMALSLHEILTDFHGLHFSIYAYNRTAYAGNAGQNNLMNIYVVKPYYQIPLRLVGNNLSIINKPDFPKGSTPTTEALEYVYRQQEALFGDTDARIIFIVTDGIPDDLKTCKVAMANCTSKVYGIYYSPKIDIDKREQLEYLFKPNLSIATSYDSVVSDVIANLERFMLTIYDNNKG